MRIVLSLAALAVTLALPLTGSPAHAQNARSWVASFGSDGNPCTRAQPCATFAHALSQTNANGEINCVDQGDFGGLFITKSITIDCEDVQARLSASSGNVVVVVDAQPTDIVVLRGLDVSGTSAVQMDFGIDVDEPAIVRIEKCVVHDTNFGGIRIRSLNASQTTEVSISDTVVVNNGISQSGAGILITPQAAGNVMKVVLNRVEARNNFFGIKVDGSQASGGVVNLTIRDSVSSGNTANGIVATTPAAGPAIIMMIDRSTSSHNAAGFGVIADGPKTTIRLGGSSIAGNINGVGVSNGGVLQSYGTNQINGNSNDGIAALTPIGLH